MREADKNSKEILIGSAEWQEYHDFFGGRIARDQRYVDQNKAPEIRWLSFENIRANRA
ncbi:hypothetical protein JXA63_04740 [Candidatus Woesebacteria bacterium]|nr:hypothetical protein [Candidatus Woesebacteria bacterium]